MAGYNGYSMSNNAVSAYESGEKPMSRWTKPAIIEEIEKLIDSDELPADLLEELKALKKEDLQTFLTWSSWHHTSAKYNKTDFYKVNPETILSRFGWKQAMFCNTPDGEKAGMWTDRNDSGIGFKHFTAADGTVYDREKVSFSRFGFIKA